jgi:hypothetical protein
MEAKLREFTTSRDIEWETVSKEIGLSIAQCKGHLRELNGRPARDRGPEAQRSQEVRKNCPVTDWNKKWYLNQIRSDLGDFNTKSAMLRKMYHAVVDRGLDERICRDRIRLANPLIEFLYWNRKAVKNIRDEFIANAQTDDDRRKAQMIWNDINVAMELLPRRNAGNGNIASNRGNEDVELDGGAGQQGDPNSDTEELIDDWFP